MLVELSVSPKGRRRKLGEVAVDPAAIADASGLHCEKTSKGAVLEGEWEPLMAAAKKWHDEALKKDETVTTVIRVVDSAEHEAHLHAANFVTVQRSEPLEDDGDWLML